jgi:hypothetical protein
MASAVKQRTFEQDEKAVADGLEAKREQRRLLLHEIEGLRAAEDQARRKSLRDHPDESAYKMGAPAQKLRQQREEKERTLAGLEPQIADLEAIANEHARERSRRDLRERTQWAGQHKVTQAECLEEAKPHLEALRSIFTEYRESVGEHRALASRVQRTNLIAQADDAELAAAWDLVCDPKPGTPQVMSLTFGRFLADLIPEDVIEKRPGRPGTSFEFMGENVAGVFGVPVAMPRE